MMKQIAEVPVEKPEKQLLLSVEEINFLVTLMDAGVKAIGIQAVKQETFSILTKLAEAANKRD